MKLELPVEAKGAQLPDEPYMFHHFHDLTVGETQTVLFMLLEAMNLNLGRVNGELVLSEKVE